MSMDKKFYIRLTEQEAKDFQEKATNVGLSRSAFARALIQDERFINESPSKEFVDAVHSLSQLGNNLNQLATINYDYQEVDREVLLKLSKEVFKLQQLITETYLV
jgi:hypothetical protein